MEDHVTIVEVSPRDGLPALCGGTSTADKIMYINSLAQAGLKKIDCVSFTHPRLIPENADAEQVVEGINKKPGVTYIGLVPNEIGCRRALVSRIDEVLTLVAVTDIFTKLNAGKSLKEHVHKTLPAIFAATAKSGKTVRSYILTAFGCPYTGKVSCEDVIQLVLKMTFMGAAEIVLVDSTGMANPKQVKELIRAISGLKLSVNLAVHFHNTRGTAIANCIAAYEAGVRTFDTSLAGMSGTPYGAMELAFGYWNIPTEDLVHLFEEMGVKTGIDMDRLLDCIRMAERLADKPLPGHILRASVSSRLAEVPDRLKKITNLGIW
jgi:hydroxymethylglutaryl-CoA lyase